jgi:hypothetical protein
MTKVKVGFLNFAKASKELNYGFLNSSLISVFGSLQRKEIFIVDRK